MKILYFAWLRERIGIGEEEIAPPPDVATVGDLMTWLSTRGENYARAFQDPGIVHAALDQIHAKPASSILKAREVAFFPPMTGG